MCIIRLDNFSCFCLPHIFLENGGFITWSPKIVSPEGTHYWWGGWYDFVFGEGGGGGYSFFISAGGGGLFLRGYNWAIVCV